MSQIFQSNYSYFYQLNLISLKQFFLLIFFLITSILMMAQTNIPAYYLQKKSFNDSLQQIVHDVGLDGNYDAGEDGMEKISFAVIDLNARKPLLGGVNMDHFIYPASVYKMYVAMEVLKQVSDGEYSLYKPYVVKSPNDVDKGREIDYDPRPLLKNNDAVTIDYLLDLMITRSDNSAANCLIDVATRNKINQTMHQYNWMGSEVTRKFLPRTFEDPGYDTVRSTVTSALHAADFMYRIYKNELINLENQYAAISPTDNLQKDKIKQEYKSVLSQALPHEEVNDTNYIFLHFGGRVCQQSWQ